MVKIPQEFWIGQRVVCSGHIGTVKYVGPLPSTEGSWLGIDWDSPLRGKHNGVYQGVQYFVTKEPTSGSFVREEKVSCGVDVASAIALRYGTNEQDSEKVDERLRQVKKALNAPFIMMVGFEQVNKKMSSFTSLEVVSLKNCNVSSAGAPRQLESMCPNIRELDLSCNLLSKWQDVTAITSQFHGLTSLDLSDNRLALPDEEVTQDKSNISLTLDDINLNSTNHSWEDVLYCARLWPNIQNLQVALNRISTLDTPQSNVLHNLRSLDLTGNHIQYWSEVNKLGSLPLLQTLNLSSNKLCDITLPENNDLFHSLKYLLLTNNRINEWSHINELEKLNLHELRIKSNPINEKNPERWFEMMVAKIGSMKRLNGEEITREERLGAEYIYIRLFGQEWQTSKQDPDLKAKFLTSHPRYQILVSKHGEAEMSEYKKANSKLESKLVLLEIKSSHNPQVLKKKFPLTMNVQKVYNFAKRVFEFETLYLVPTKNRELKIPLDEQLRSLDFYSLEEGDVIIAE
ncbi:tubulin-specific chaperone E [Nilaparvata lugens]|uniref:tubulin-specific chaperone E n=1 Tax=Nilaparvata lugens TaxID=108931 RepID=UPI00193D0F53|nr:tubulin-specific chaperone E [Nilaparvata lugens]XP_022184291.2 tubulin-specific chaperone E [Nilaparvata lugens]